MLKKLALILVIILAPVTVLSQTGTNQSLEKIDLQLAWEYEYQFAGFIAAKELGFYEEAGFDVEMHELKYGMSIYDRLRSGKVQYAIGNTNAIVARNNGTPVVVLAVIFQHSPFVILTKSESDIYSPPDLIGKKVCVYKTNNSIFYAMLQSEGVNMDDVEIAEYDSEYGSLISGETDATTAMSTLQPYVFEKLNIDYRIMNPQAYGIDFYSNCIITSETEIEENPERVKKFREASLRGWTYAMRNKGKIIDLMIEKYTPDTPRELLEFEADAMDDIMHPNLIEIGHMNPGRWQYIIDKYKELGMIDQGFTIEGLLYDPNPVQDLSELLRILKILGISLTIVSIISVGLLLFNRRLKRAEREKAKTIEELKKAMAEIKTLQGMLPICASCKKIRNDGGFWENVETYISKHTLTEFSHGICPDCLKEIYPDYYDRVMNQSKDDSSGQKN